jgi:glycosyltransferase involved in cell wall biosynthesis
MFAGNIGESQSFPAILDAADLLRNDDVRWVIVGDGRAADQVRAEVERRGLGDRFLLVGRYPNARMPSFYRHASALLVSLRKEPIFAMTIPGKIQSYLAFGLPVLGMLDGEGARVIQEARAGFTCEADDAEGLAAIVARMASAPERERTEMGARGAEYARREFDRDLLIEKLERILGDAVNASPAGGDRS